MRFIQSALIPTLYRLRVNHDEVIGFCTARKIAEIREKNILGKNANYIHISVYNFIQVLHIKTANPSNYIVGICDARRSLSFGGEVFFLFLASAPESI